MPTNDAHKSMGGKAVIQRYCKDSNIKGEGDNGQVEQPLILAICTPLMSRVHSTYLPVQRTDASSSFEDFNNPLFVMSISSAAGSLPLGIVVTLAESAGIVHKGIATLKELFPESAFYRRGYTANIISLAEREGLHQTWLSLSIFVCTFHFLHVEMAFMQ